MSSLCSLAVWLGLVQLAFAENRTVEMNLRGSKLELSSLASGASSSCCEQCSSQGFCSPHSGHCYESKAKSYYLNCATPLQASHAPPAQPTPPLPSLRYPLAPVTPGSDAQGAGWNDAGEKSARLLGHAEVAGEKSARLLGKTLRMKVDVGNTGCGCVTGIYLVERGDGGQCDASGTFGGRCGEIDLMEGNKFGWHTTLHNGNDHPGLAGGFGGVQQPDMQYGKGPRDMSSDQYGPGASIVDTNREFNVAISFPEAPGGALRDMVVMMWQEGNQNAVEWRVNKPRADASRSPPLNCNDGGCDNCFSKPGCVYGDGDMQQFGSWLSNGMTPLATFWDGGGQQTWLDGTLPGEGGRCELTSQGQPGTENLGSYNAAGCDGASFHIGSWTLETIQNAPDDWDAYFSAMDAAPVIPQ